MIEKAIKTIEKYGMLKDGDGVVVGVSGGPDSLTLLHFLNSIKDRYALKIFCAHINHCLRGVESDQEEEYVKNICREWDIQFFSKRIDIKEIAKNSKVSEESAGRIERYAYFEEVLKVACANKIAVAHNANDNTETILMRILRGTGLDGLCGIKPVRGNIIRPLIETTRDEIMCYCNNNGLSPKIDSSNSDTKYTRNKIRLELLPYLGDNFNPNIIETINRMSNIIALDVEFLSYHTEKICDDLILHQNKEYISIDLDKINKQSQNLISRILRNIIYRLKGDLIEIEHTNIEDILSFINNAKTGSQFDLPNGLKLKKSYNELGFYKRIKETGFQKYNYILKIPGETLITETGSMFETYLADEIDTKTDKYTQAFDYEKINSKVHIRTRQDGDIINPKGMKGSKKLKDYFIDKKVPKEKRDEIPLVTVDSEVIWIVGDRISEKYKADDNTKKVLIIKYIW